MTREELIDSLTATAPGAWYPGDEGDERYMDWTVRTPDGGYTLEVGNGADAIRLGVSRDELAELHRALTITLLAES